MRGGLCLGGGQRRGQRKLRRVRSSEARQVLCLGTIQPTLLHATQCPEQTASAPPVHNEGAQVLQLRRPLPPQLRDGERGRGAGGGWRRGDGQIEDASSQRPYPERRSRACVCVRTNVACVPVSCPCIFLCRCVRVHAYPAHHEAASQSKIYRLGKQLLLRITLQVAIALQMYQLGGQLYSMITR